MVYWTQIKHNLSEKELNSMAKLSGDDNKLIKSVSIDSQSNSIVVDLGFCRVFVPHAVNVYDVTKFTDFKINLDVVEFNSGNLNYPDDAMCLTTAVFGEDDKCVVRYKPKETGYLLNANVLVESDLPRTVLSAHLERALRKEGSVTWIEES